VELRVTCLERQPLQFLGFGKGRLFLSALQRYDLPSRIEAIEETGGNQGEEDGNSKLEETPQDDDGFHFTPVHTKVWVPRCEEQI
jgi:hypothetical protein